MANSNKTYKKRWLHVLNFPHQNFKLKFQLFSHYFCYEKRKFPGKVKTKTFRFNSTVGTAIKFYDESCSSCDFIFCLIQPILIYMNYTFQAEFKFYTLSKGMCIVKCLYSRLIADPVCQSSD
jgi:hypothetical protein